MKNTNSLLKDKNVLYIIAFFSIMNVFGYVIAQNWDAVVFFGILGYLTTFFNKNMIIVLLVAMIGTNFLVSSRFFGRKIVEGMSINRRKKIKHVKNRLGDADDDLNQLDTNGALGDKSKNATEKKTNKLDYASTLEEAYNNLDTLIGKKGVSKMTEQTHRLAKQQKELMKNMEGLQPAIESAKSMLEGLPLDGIGNLQNAVSDVMNKLSSVTGK